MKGPEPKCPECGASLTYFLFKFYLKSWVLSARIKELKEKVDVLYELVEKIEKEEGL